MRDRTVVFIVCDAIRWDYLNEEDSPFLLSLAENGIYVRKIKPSLGFCERTEMFSGARPEDSGYFTALTFDKEKSDFKNISNLELDFIKFLKNFSYLIGHIHPFLYKAFNYVIIDNIYLKKIRKIGQPSYNIPLEFLKEIALTEDYVEMCNKNALSVETIFDIMIEEKKSFLYRTFASLRMDVGYSDDSRIKKLFSEAQKRSYDLYLLYFGEGDGVGHRYGPNSKERREMVKRIDRRIKNVVGFFEKKYNDVDFFIVGDHGMVQVKKYINALDKIRTTAKKYGLKLNEDYNFFLDSTLIRIWFSNNKSSAIFKEMIESDEELSEHGSILTKEKVLEYELPSNIEYYGDLIWLANPGVVIFPDFFHGQDKVKGMHGYDPSIDEQKGFAIVYSKEEVYKKHFKEKDLIDVCPTLCELLNIREPKDNQGAKFL